MFGAFDNVPTPPLVDERVGTFSAFVCQHSTRHGPWPGRAPCVCSVSGYAEDEQVMGWCQPKCHARRR